MSSNWKFHQVCMEGVKLEIGGIDVWEHAWIVDKESPNVEVHDPLYNQKHSFRIYIIQSNGKIIRFAAGEFSNCIWGFYI